MPSSSSYRLGDEIGRGALGRVVLVHTGAGEILAGKMLHESHLDPAASQRFASEARILGDIDHPNLVRVIGLEEIDGREVLLMEYIEGPSLAAVIARESPIEEARIVAIATGLAAGLAAAHHAGLMHRDLKPANVLLTGAGSAKIVDFGLARATSFEGVDPDAFAIVGTPDYMAPESVEPLSVDPRSDIYALGCILFEMATGRPPYGGATAFTIIEAHRQAPIPEVIPNRDLSPALVDLIGWLLAKSPADRPQSATVVERELGELAAARSAGSELVLRRDVALFGGECAACGEPLIAGVGVCFGCGFEPPSLMSGGYSVFVVGPGEVAAKIDTKLRQVLLDWLRANPSLGLDPTPLTTRVPRLPFALVTGVAEASATSLSRSLQSLGFICEIHRGGRFALRAVRKKAWKLGGRITAIVAGSGAAFSGQVGAPLLILPLVTVGLVGSLGAGWYMAGRRVVRQDHSHKLLPPVLAESVSRVAGVVPAIDQRRHRESLRAVVQRVLALRSLLAERGVEELDGELARILDLAVVASSRVDELESELAAVDLREPGEEVRAKLRQRDMWAARLLEAAAFLDAFRARYAAAERGGEAQATRAALDELNHQVEALAEVAEL